MYEKQKISVVSVPTLEIDKNIMKYDDTILKYASEFSRVILCNSASDGIRMILGRLEINI